MNIFEFRDKLVADYRAYVESFMRIRNPRIQNLVRTELDQGRLWPEPLIQLNPSFAPGGTIEDFVREGILHPECARIFRSGKREGDGTQTGVPLTLHRHQADAIRAARMGKNYLLTTGTGSGKSLSYIIPIVDLALRQKRPHHLKAIVVYPMNALANSQFGELKKFLCYGYAQGSQPVTFACYTGQESQEQRAEILENPPDILLTNYVMLELMLTRPREKRLMKAATGLRFLVFDELHTYRGRQGADVGLLIRRVRERLDASDLQCVGTSATLAGQGDYQAQRQEIARRATILFGAPFESADIIGETLRRTTIEWDGANPALVEGITKQVQSVQKNEQTQEDFANQPLASWIESTFGVRCEAGSGRLVRSTPRTMKGEKGAAGELSRLTGLALDTCVEAIESVLNSRNGNVANGESTTRPFAFRLHQFISRGDTVYGTLEPEPERYLTVHGQQFQPGDRSRVLFPFSFCRECGQEYYTVYRKRQGSLDRPRLVPRELSDRSNHKEMQAGFVYCSQENPWPADPEAILERVPDDWIEDFKGTLRIRSDKKADLPVPLRLGTDGTEDSEGLAVHFVAAPFTYCLNCRVAYDARLKSDFPKLTTLGSEGRSTATTILSLSAIRALRQEPEIGGEARKILSFTDNRQDASLQAGHFNDFVELGLLRAALYGAVKEAGDRGIPHESLTDKVFQALKLPLSLYSQNPEVKFGEKAKTERALREILGYRLYRDLRRGWRITAPNLEQCNLLKIEYESLSELCGDPSEWKDKHPALRTATRETRQQVATVLLDHMRRSLAIKVDFLREAYQEQIQRLSSEYLRDPWKIDENERMETASNLFPRPTKGRGESFGNIFLSGRSRFGQYLRRKKTFPDFDQPISIPERQTIIIDLLQALAKASIVEEVVPGKDDEAGAYQVKSGAMIWKAGDGQMSYHDPLTTPIESQVESVPNRFFVNFYTTVARELLNVEAREHTAQVSNEERKKREQLFREGKLTALFCSPTMELGIDISDLCLVNLRNVPPTPANYAQRSGRAGRSGQPALVYTYCAAGSSHDQYFFKRPPLMVAGAVQPPRLDLTNEDLIRSHIHAVWLAESGIDLKSSLKEILDVTGDPPTLKLLETIQQQVENPTAIQKTADRVTGLLESIWKSGVPQPAWYRESWLAQVLQQIPSVFNQTCDRWRELYQAAKRQFEVQNKVIGDATRSQREKDTARQLRREAEKQLELLVSEDEIRQSDFYSYRYFASEGFLPGYSFPRLPISAFINARKNNARDEYVSRPRFLAISEFGPRAIVYHEGSRYEINRVIFPSRDDQTEDLPTSQAKQCTHCGYFHPITDISTPDVCERCGSASLEKFTAPLLRMVNVSTRRRDRISSDEEERLRQGFEIRSGIRFTNDGEVADRRTAEVRQGDEMLATLTYGDRATLWRINLGWRRRQNRELHGFLIDKDRGAWGKNELDDNTDDEPQSNRTVRVIPCVQDTKNCLLLEFATTPSQIVMATLESALKRAIQVCFQLEDSELAAEALPNDDDRQVLLFYEAAEGGAGVLKQLVDNPHDFARVAREALAICHFDPDTGDDQRRGPNGAEDCEAACYDCLMNYSNQLDHELLDRQSVRDVLFQLKDSLVHSSPTAKPRNEHLEWLHTQCESGLEKSFLDFLDQGGYRLPSRGQVYLEHSQTRPDFLYENERVAIYVDGPHHEFPERQVRDSLATECLEDRGYTVLRFRLRDDWKGIVKTYSSIFGTGRAS